MPDLSLFFLQGHFQLWAGTAYLPVIKSLITAAFSWKIQPMHRPPLTWWTRNFQAAKKPWSLSSLVNMNCQSFKSYVARHWQLIQPINPTQLPNQSACLRLSVKVASRIAIVTPALPYPSAASHLPVFGGRYASCILDAKLPYHFCHSHLLHLLYGQHRSCKTSSPLDFRSCILPEARSKA